MQQSSSRNIMPFIISLIFLVGMAMGFGLNYKINGGDFFSKNKGSALQEISNLIQLKYVDPIAVDSLNDFAIEELLAHIDPHSVYISPNELQSVNNEMEGQFVGIGIQYDFIDDTLNILNIIENGPAKKAGLLIGDKILSVNDTLSLVGKKFKSIDVKDFLRGDEGSELKVNILRDNTLKTVQLKRSSIPITSIDVAYMLEKNIGYIRINKFGERTYEEFMQRLETLQKQKIKKLIIDLRNNGGGYMHAATAIADEFLDGDKLIVYTQGNKSKRTEIRCKKEGLYEKGELEILVDENTASASEVLTGALQDWDRATVIGRRTFGKGLVQQQYNLSNGGALRLTVARYYTPLGRNIQKSYQNGKKEYQNEIEERYIDGEMLDKDSILTNGKSYKTPKGKMVYGGGGIIPDVFVPIDTTNFESLHDFSFNKILEKFVYTYYLNHKLILKQYKSIEEFTNQFFFSNDDWKNFELMLSKDTSVSVSLNHSLKEKVEKNCKIYLSRVLFNNEAFFKTQNKYDTLIQIAVKDLNKN